MSPLAEILHSLGYTLTGSDVNESDNVNRLRTLGIPIFMGHAAENIGDAELVVFTAAVNAANPELAAARERGIPLLERAKPVFTTLPGWKSDVRGITEYDALPANAKAYADFIEKEIETPIKIVSTGPKRHEIAMRP